MAMIQQHETIRVPANWRDQERALVIQLERILDDIYRHFKKLGKDDLSKEILDLLATYDQAVEDLNDLLEFVGDSSMGTTADTITGAIAEHESDISSAGQAIGNLQQDVGTLQQDVLTLSGSINAVATELGALYGLTVTQLKAKGS